VLSSLSESISIKLELREWEADFISALAENLSSQSDSITATFLDIYPI
jgi:hypothetical protein